MSDRGYLAHLSLRLTLARLVCDHRMELLREWERKVLSL